MYVRNNPCTTEILLYRKNISHLVTNKKIIVSTINFPLIALSLLNLYSLTNQTELLLSTSLVCILPCLTVLFPCYRIIILAGMGVVVVVVAAAAAEGVGWNIMSLFDVL